jgi:hypothetical protein
MGYELEARAPAAYTAFYDDGRYPALERRWQLANERLALALAVLAALRGRVTPDDPEWLAAQLRIAQARQRCREASDERERLEDELLALTAGT